VAARVAKLELHAERGARARERALAVGGGAREDQPRAVGRGDALGVLDALLGEVQGKVAAEERVLGVVGLAGGR
jgi:hypothetical protein